MRPKTASRLVGLITIETLPNDRDAAGAPPSDHDATLAEFLGYLANGEARGDGRATLPVISRLTPRRLTGGRADCIQEHLWVRPTLLTANLHSLATQLDRLLRQTRRKTASQPQSAA